MRAAIVGSSLGGPTAALLLHELGVEVDVYERSPAELVRRGAGIGFLPDAVLDAMTAGRASRFCTPEVPTSCAYGATAGHDGGRHIA